MKSLALSIAVIAAALLLATPALAKQRDEAKKTTASFRTWTACTARLSATSELACASWHYKHASDVLTFLRTHPKIGAAAVRTRIARNHSWLKRFALTRIAEAKARLAPLYPPHHQLWLCIHSGEGAWNDHDSGGNGHYGGLQMHWSWGYGIVGDAGNYSEAEQEWAAERGYRASGMSSAFLWQQWAADARCFA